LAAPKANINSEMLEWARKEAGLSLAEAAHQAKIKATKLKTPEERLEDWEKGRDYPTQNQLNQIAKAFYRPVLTFYMTDPPIPNDDVADFRTVADEDIGRPSPALRALVSKMKARQQEVLDILLEREEPPEPLPFIGSFPNNRDDVAIAKDLERVLELPLARRENLSDNAALLRLIRNCAEEAGVYVLAEGDLGSHHTDIPPTVFRGFVLADPIAPFIVLNDNDAKPAQTFTLVHELAHLWIGDSGISNFDPFDRAAGNETERFCNEVAAEFLMPRREIARAWEAYRDYDTADTVLALSKEFSVSRAAIAHRLWKMEQIPEDTWWALYGSYKKEWEAWKAKQREQEEAPPLYFSMKKSQLGRKLISTVLRSVEAGEITYTRASRILNAAPSSFEKLRA